MTFCMDLGENWIKNAKKAFFRLPVTIATVGVVVAVLKLGASYSLARGSQQLSGFRLGWFQLGYFGAYCRARAGNKRVAFCFKSVFHQGLPAATTY